MTNCEDAGMAPEPFRSRWGRRSRTVPLMLGVTVLGVLGSPMIVVAAALADLARGRYRLPTVRVALFLIQYGINDSVEILLAPVYWARAGFGRRLGSAPSIERHERLQRWSIDVLARRAERLLGLRIEFDQASVDALTPGPTLVLCRHVNLVDASLPTLLHQRIGVRTRGVIMAELLADPGFDLVYGRTGSVFIPRDDGPQAMSMLRSLGHGNDASTAVVIFPEGRLFRPDRLQRDLARLAERNPERAALLGGLRHVLPPRPGGVVALLDSVDGDVVVIVHAGLDRFASFKELAAAVPVREPIRVAAWRVPRGQVPTDDAERIAWLDEQWLRVDDWVAERT